jgi:hypothetical protein
MRCSSKIKKLKKLGVALLLVSSLVGGIVSSGHADDGDSTPPVIVEPTQSQSGAPLVIAPAITVQPEIFALAPVAQAPLVTAPSCPMAVGSSVTSYNRFATAYRINRLSDNANGGASYEAVVNPTFTLGAAVPASSIDVIKQRYGVCLAQVGVISGPGNDTLTIRTANAAEKATLPTVSIALKIDGRTNMVSWGVSEDCSTLTHETLHLLGLVDLYTEGDGPPTHYMDDPASNYNCRVNGPSDGIMFDQEKGAALTYGYYKAIYCSCDSDGFRACSKELSTISGVPDACPALTNESTPGGYEINVLNDPLDSNHTIQKFIDDGLVAGKHEESWSFHGEKKITGLKPLLYPAEFREITQPGCKDQNSVYESCAANAYRSTSDRGGCKTPAPQCSDPNLWLQ